LAIAEKVRAKSDDLFPWMYAIRENGILLAQAEHLDRPKRNRRSFIVEHPDPRPMAAVSDRSNRDLH
jgi:hypothetical protein